MKRLLTHSRLKDARACLRLHHFKYDLGYRPVVEADATRFGSLIHRGLEAWWRFGQLDGRFGDNIALESALVAARTPIDDVALDPFDLARAEELLRGYHARWRMDYEVLDVEKRFQGELVNPSTGATSRTWLLGGKIDAIARDRQGRVLVVEHKTSSEDISPGSDYWIRLRMDAQVSIYHDGARVLGHDVEGCLYDVVKKPGIRPLKANTRRDADETPAEFAERLRADIAAAPEKYFQRGEVVRLEEDLEEHRFDLWQLGQILREAEAAGRFPRNPDACKRYGRSCEYLPVCSRQASLDDPTLYRRSSITHPELGQATAEQEG